MAARIGFSLVPKPDRLSRFVDSVRVKFQGGKGGDGCISMLKEFAREFGGPDGGNGGNGGHVVLVANQRVKSLSHLAAVYRGLPGEIGMSKCMFGKNADHILINVPVGTTVIKATPIELINDPNRDPNESDVVAELDEEGSMFIGARGGAGGRGNATYLSNKNRHPRVAQAGAKGEENHYELRMRLYAHIGLIGFPNSGKSTLLRTLTHARVKVGDYSFTTLYPQLGTLQYNDYCQVAIADLPGLIEDSHKNRGLGLKFLHNCTRCACLLYVIDMSRDPVQQMVVLSRELEAYEPGLSRKSHVILGNKMDLPEAEEQLTAFRAYLAAEWPTSDLILGSSERGHNLEDLRLLLKKMHDQYQEQHRDNLESSLVW